MKPIRINLCFFINQFSPVWSNFHILLGGYFYWRINKIILLKNGFAEVLVQIIEGMKK